MTTSISNAQSGERLSADLAAPPLPPVPAVPPAAPPGSGATVSAHELPRTVWSRFIILMLCLAVVMTTLAFGTVHAWSLAAFQLSAALVFALWMLDAWRTRVLRVSLNPLQLPLVGLFAVGLAQLCTGLSFDPQATRVSLVQLAGLLVYFGAALAFVDSHRRLKLMARLVIIFGFLLAVYGLMQHFINPRTIFWVREPKQAEPFGPYINRHHFAGYMELVLAMPLGLMFAGAIARERMLLYAFASAMMAISLVLTNSRGGLISMVFEVLFLAAVSSLAGSRRRAGEELDRGERIRAAAVRIGLGFAMVIAVFIGVLYFGGEGALSRMLGTVNSADPTTGRAHFWSGALQIIRDHPWLGTGLGSFGSIYTRYDTNNGAYRLDQAHNDYLQIFSDAGVVGGVLGIVFIGVLYFGGEGALSRMLGTVNSADPTTGRAHFWSGALQIIRDHPWLGTGLGSFGSIYTRYDTSNGAYRLDQAHNDYLQIFSDAGVVGGVLGIVFVVLLFRMALRRIQSHDRFRRGVALGALAGCAGVLVHSFFDFTLHTTANGLMFLLLAALATADGRVEEHGEGSRRRRRRRRRHEGSDARDDVAEYGGGAPEKEGAAV